MKKVSLLLTILCAGQLYGMENTDLSQGAMEPEKKSNLGAFEQLPPELRQIVAQTALELSTDINQAITIAKILPINNLKDFTKLVHILADKFEYYTTQDIAKAFKTPASKAYLDLAKELADAIYYGDVNKVTESIKKGADVNFDTNDIGFSSLPLLFYAISRGGGGNEVIKLLIDNGVNLNYFKDGKNQTVFEYVKKYDSGNKELIKLLENYGK